MHILNAFHVNPGDTLLVIRGSNLGVVYAQKGPIVQEVQNFPWIPIF